MEDMLRLAYGAAGNMALMIITITAVWLPTESELSLSLHECIKFLLPLLILAVPAELGGSEDGRSLFPLVQGEDTVFYPPRFTLIATCNITLYLIRSPLKGVIQN